MRDFWTLFIVYSYLSVFIKAKMYVLHKFDEMRNFPIFCAATRLLDCPHANMIILMQIYKRGLRYASIQFFRRSRHAAD